MLQAGNMAQYPATSRLSSLSQTVHSPAQESLRGATETTNKNLEEALGLAAQIFTAIGQEQNADSDKRPVGGGEDLPGRFLRRGRRVRS
jgi:hypothetical protein